MAAPVRPADIISLIVGLRGQQQRAAEDTARQQRFDARQAAAVQAAQRDRVRLLQTAVSQGGTEESIGQLGQALGAAPGVIQGVSGGIGRRELSVEEGSRLAQGLGSALFDANETKDPRAVQALGPMLASMSQQFGSEATKRVLQFGEAEYRKLVRQDTQTRAKEQRKDVRSVEVARQKSKLKKGGDKEFQERAFQDFLFDEFSESGMPLDEFIAGNSRIANENDTPKRLSKNEIIALMTDPRIIEMRNRQKAGQESLRLALEAGTATQTTSVTPTSTPEQAAAVRAALARGVRGTQVTNPEEIAAVRSLQQRGIPLDSPEAQKELRKFVPGAGGGKKNPKKITTEKGFTVELAD